MLQARNLSKIRKNSAVLKNVHLSLVPGKVLGVLSLDKIETTTLLDVLSGQDKPDAGVLELNGKALTLNKKGWGNHGIQMIPGSERLFSNLSILDNLLVGLARKGRRVVHLDKLIAKVRPTVQEFGLKFSLETHVSKLSIAERQVLSLVLFFLIDADFLLLRDCFANLSLEQYQKFSEKLAELKSQNKGILLVPETPSQIFDLCDDVVLLRSGKVIYSGKVTEIEIDEVHNILNNSPYMIRQAVENKFNQFHNNVTRPEILFERSLKVVANFCGLPNAFFLFHGEEGQPEVRFSKYWNKATKYGLEKGVQKLLDAMPLEKRLGLLHLGTDQFLWYALSAEKDDVALLVVEAEDHPPFPFREIRKELSATYRGIKEKIRQEKIARELELSSYRLAQEMDIARNIQSSILPKNPNLPGYKIATHSETATEVGGDSFDIIRTPLGNFISIGDVSGHGLPSGIMALIEMSALHGIVQSQLAFGVVPGPDKIYDMINRVLCEINRDRIGSDKFMTKLLLVELNGRFYHAGTHEIGLFYSRERNEVIELSDMIDRTAFLGISEYINSEGSLGSFAMEPGDFLLLYTDGLIEAKSESSEQFGIDRVKEILLEKREKEPAEILQALVSSLYSYSESGDMKLHSGHLADDLTLILLQKE
ncbi:MAG: SpoIIE family protein phosphatase [Spirochaetales bacterium]|nr:SpoIIE family protein phosphatase [Spirochaetales bacterium]